MANFLRRVELLKLINCKLVRIWHAVSEERLENTAIYDFGLGAAKCSGIANKAIMETLDNGQEHKEPVDVREGYCGFLNFGMKTMRGLVKATSTRKSGHPLGLVLDDISKI